MIRIIQRGLTSGSLKYYTALDVTTLKMGKVLMPPGVKIVQSDFRENYIAIAFTNKEKYENNLTDPWRNINTRSYFLLGTFAHHEYYLDIDGVEYHYNDVYDRFGEIQSILENKRVEETLKEITE